MLVKLDDIARPAMPGETQEMWDEFKALCEKEYAEWKKRNPAPLPYIWMTNLWFDRMEERSRSWVRYIDPIAARYWVQHGFRLFYRDGSAYIEPLTEAASPDQPSANPT